jgi:hypothetical protein
MTIEQDALDLSPTEEKTNMSALHTKALNQTVALLSGMGFNFAIIDLDGVKHGQLEVLEKPKREFVQSFKEYVTPILDALQIGQLISVPFDKFEGGDLQSNICSRANSRWGDRCIMTVIKRDKKIVEVLRLK